MIPGLPGLYFNHETQQLWKRRHAMNTTRKQVTRDSVIGEVIRDYPGAKDIIQKYFGGGCFTCPGINMESISFGSMMHNLDPDKIIKEINELGA
jgi:hybrid cluster-associated redox disulfide protein